MASSLLNPNPNPFLKPNPAVPPAQRSAAGGSVSATTSHCYVPVRCGPRDGRGPLVKGRTLSIEAIQAVQSLKRARRSNPDDLSSADKTLSRLIKSDLVAALRELLRQGECAIGLRVLAALRSEYPAGGPERLSLYAEAASALARVGEAEAIDELVAELEREVGAIDCNDRKGLGRLLNAVIGAGRKESTVRICRMMRRSGWESTCTVEDHLVKVLIRGLRSFGELGLADEIERDLSGVLNPMNKIEATLI